MAEGDIISNGGKIEDALDADVYFYAGPIHQEGIFLLKEKIVKKQRRHKQAFLYLTTNGGDPSAAYRLVGCLRQFYPDGGFSLFSFGWCKSAGTLVAVGAKELILSYHGELGPLDVQLTRRDDVFGYNSGMDIHAAIGAVIQSAQSAFDQVFLDTCKKGNNNISIKLAADIASNIVTRLFSGVMDQITPLQLGETRRAMDIAIHYAKNINPTNISEDKIFALVTNYPAHNFVIDLAESKKLFTNVREPDNREQMLGMAMGMHAYTNEVKLAELEDISLNDDFTQAFVGGKNEQRANETGTDEKLGAGPALGGVVEQLRRKSKSKQG